MKDKSDQSGLASTKRLIGALLRMPPKPHNEMKIGKRKPRRKATKEKS
jgi:hypothetical protein